MAEKNAKCPMCGRAVPETSRFCEVCGSPVGPAIAEMSQPGTAPQQSTHKTPEWTIVVIVLVVIAVIMIPALAYSMPWSKIKIIVTHDQYSQVGVDVYIDGVMKGSVGVSPGTTIVGVWSVTAGTHTVQIDRGSWWWDEGWFSSSWEYSEPDGHADFTYAYEVGPLYTKNVYVTLT